MALPPLTRHAISTSQFADHPDLLVDGIDDRR